MFNKDFNPTTPVRQTPSGEEARAVEPEKPKAPKGQNPTKFKDVLGPEDKAKKLLKNGSTVSFDDEDEDEGKPSLFGLAGLPSTRQLPQTGDEGTAYSGFSDEETAQNFVQEPIEGLVQKLVQDPVQDPATAEALMQGNVKPVLPTDKTSLDPTLPKTTLGTKKTDRTTDAVTDLVDAKVPVDSRKMKIEVPLDPRTLDSALESKKPEVTVESKKGEVKLDPAQILAQSQRIPAEVPQIVAPDLNDAAARELSRLRTHELQAIVRQIVDAVTTISTTDLTTTLITLKHPPIFEGATLQITEYDTAKNQFNLTFGNLDQLPPEARRLIESTENQSVLRQNLIDRGYTLQMVTIESELKPIHLAEGAQTETRYTRDQKKEEDQGTTDPDQRFA